MSEFWHSAAGWAVQTAVAGGAVFGLARLALWRVRQPARRERLTAWAVRAGVLVAVLAAFPAWLRVPVPGWAAPPVPAVELNTGEETAVVASDRPAPRSDGRLAYLPPPSPDVIADAPPPLADVPQPILPAAELRLDTPASPATAPTAQPPARADLVAEVAPLVLIPFAALGLVAAGQLVLGHVGLVRLRRRGRPVPAAIRAAADELAGGRQVDVLVCDGVSSPVCFGLLRPTVLLPKALAAHAPAEVVRWVLAHELDHVRRGDPWTGFWAGIARCVYFPLPWFWAVRRELSLAQEYLADAAAATAGGRPVEYAAFLVDLSAGPGESRPGRPPLARLAGSAGMRAERSDLFRRVTMLVQPNQRVEARAPRLWAALAAGGILSTGVALSGLGVATADEPKRVKVVVVADDEDQKKDEAKPKDGDKKDREKKVEMRRVEVRERADLKAIEKEIEKAAEKGDKEALKAAVEKLHKAIAAHIIPVVVEAGGKNVLGGQLHLHGPDGLKQPLTAKVTLLRAAADEETAKLEKAIEKLKKTAEELKDQPEARAAIEKSIAEFKKKIAEAKKKGEIKPATPVAPAPPVPPVPPAEFFRVQPGQFQFRGVPAGDMGKLTEQLAKQLEQTLKQQAEQLEALKDNPAAAEAMKKAQDAYKKAIEQAMKQLRENQPRLWMAEPQGRQPQFRDVPIARTAVLARGRLGVTLQPVPEAVVEQLDLPKDKGLLVAGVAEGSPAAKAGIKANDILLSVAGKDVAADPGAATRQVAALKPGEATDVVVLRKGKKQTISVTLPEEKKADVEKRAETPRKPDAPRAAARPKVAGGEGGSDAKSMRVTVTVNDDEFNIRADRDGVRYTIDGKLDGGKPVPSAIVIRADGKSSEFSSWEKVPAEHRDAVKKLLTSVSGGR